MRTLLLALLFGFGVPGLTADANVSGSFRFKTDFVRYTKSMSEISRKEVGVRLFTFTFSHLADALIQSDLQ